MKHEIVEAAGKYTIVRHYANTENGTVRGDIYYTREDVLSNHPHTNVLEGYGIVYTKTGEGVWHADEWYNTVEDAWEFIDSERYKED